MTGNLNNRLHDLLILGKIKIMFPVSLTGFTGYFIFDPRFTARLLIVTTGIFILAVSASILNQIQEAGIDARMERTKDRPIPAGKVTRGQAGLLFLLCLITGTFIIYYFGNIIAAGVGFFTIFLYNGVYTYLKKLTAFAVFPGALTGALPPLIGWVAAGGPVWDKSIIFLEFLFFVGQIPHFWLLLMKHGRDYEKAGLPTITSILSKSQINRLTFTWIVTTLTAGIFLYHFRIIQKGIIIAVLLLASLVMIWQFSGLLKKSTDNNNSGRYSLLLNSYFLLVMLLLISDRIIV
jgi:protoheme IX farnesyltransferase